MDASPVFLQPLLDSRAALLAFVRSRVHDEAAAEDVLQDSLVRALRAAPTLRDETRLVSWFYQILRHAIADHYRRQVREVEGRAAYAREQEALPTPEEEQRLCQCFEALLPTLHPAYAEVLRVVDLRETPYAEAAEALGISPDNLKVRRMRARRQLRQRLDEMCRTCADHGCLDCTCRA